MEGSIFFFFFNFALFLSEASKVPPEHKHLTQRRIQGMAERQFQMQLLCPNTNLLSLFNHFDIICVSRTGSSSKHVSPTLFKIHLALHHSSVVIICRR